MFEILYRFIKYLQIKRRNDHIVTDPNLNLFEKKAKYFEYELHKANRFFLKFPNVEFTNKNILEIGTNVGGYLKYLIENKSNFNLFYGVEIDKANSEYAKKQFENYSNIHILNQDARNISLVEDHKIDIIYSDAVIEHIKDLNIFFKEMNRVLVKNGQVCFATSPIWLTWNGGHIIRYIPIPWCHLFFSDKLILSLINRMKEDDLFSIDSLCAIEEIYQTIGKLTLKKLKKAIILNNFEIEYLENHSNSKIKRWLFKIPIIGEFFAGDIVLKLRKK